jgi:cysteine synthase
MNHASRVYDSVLEMLPNEENPSPLVRINRMNPAPGVDLFAKLEWMNPFGSVKDRAAAALIESLEAQGKLNATRGLVEPTSGNTGISLAAIASMKGYKMRAIVPQKVPDEKKVLLKIAGAELDVINDQMCPSPGMGEGSIGIAKTYAKAQPDRYVMPNQYENRANAEAHIRTTGPEIWRQTEGKITHFFTSLGTCGTVTGCATYLKAKNPSIKVIAVQPSEGHDVPGLRNMSELHVSKLFDASLIDEILEIDFEKAYTTALALCRSEGLFAGPSSGLIFEGARTVLSRAPGLTSGCAVMIFCDNIFKYVSSMTKHIPELAPEQP